MAVVTPTRRAVVYLIWSGAGLPLRLLAPSLGSLAQPAPDEDAPGHWFGSYTWRSFGIYLEYAALASRLQILNAAGMRKPR